MSDWPADGIFRIENLQTQLSLAYANTHPNAPVSISSQGSMSSVDWWHVQPSGIKAGANGPSLFWIINVATGCFLTASDDQGNMTMGVQGTWDPSSSTTNYQAWAFHSQSGKPNQYSIENYKQTGLVLAPSPSGSGGYAITSANTGGKDQIWRLNKLYPH